jgi:hypothetical protein
MYYLVFKKHFLLTFIFLFSILLIGLFFPNSKKVSIEKENAFFIYHESMFFCYINGKSGDFIDNKVIYFFFILKF